MPAGLPAASRRSAPRPDKAWPGFLEAVLTVAAIPGAAVVPLGGPALRRRSDLRQVILDALPPGDPDLVVVVTAPAPGPVTEEVGRTARELRARGLPVVHVQAPGTDLDGDAGRTAVAAAILDQLTDGFADRELRSCPCLVNVIAGPPFRDPFWKGNLGELKRILAGVGLEANLLCGPDSAGARLII